jgi:hypothetical protein
MQVRAKVMNDELADEFKSWSPNSPRGMGANSDRKNTTKLAA